MCQCRYSRYVGEPNAETQETYGLIADAYAQRNSTVNPQLHKDAESLRADLPSGSLVADIGCGPGRDVAFLRESGYRVIGLDFSIGQLRSGGLSGVAQADMRRLPMRTDGVDAIWCHAALLHLSRADVPAVLSEFSRVVRVGGLLYLAVAEGDGEAWEVASAYGSGRRRWFTYHRESDLTALLASAGFEVYRTRRMQSHRRWLALYARKS